MKNILKWNSNNFTFLVFALYHIDIITSCIYEITTNYIFLKKKSSYITGFLQITHLSKKMMNQTQSYSINWMCHRWHKFWLYILNVPPVAHFHLSQMVETKKFFFHQKKFQIIYSGISEKNFKKYYFLGGMKYRVNIMEKYTSF